MGSAPPHAITKRARAAASGRLHPSNGYLSSVATDILPSRRYLNVSATPTWARTSSTTAWYSESADEIMPRVRVSTRAAASVKDSMALSYLSTAPTTCQNGR